MEYENGEFSEIERHATIPENFEGATKLAAVRLSHDQKFLYISNRGHDSIAIFKLGDNGSTISLVDIVASGGAFPRDFNISESDDFLVCAHQEGDYEVVVFKRQSYWKIRKQMTIKCTRRCLCSVFKINDKNPENSLVFGFIY